MKLKKVYPSIVHSASRDRGRHSNVRLVHLALRCCHWHHRFPWILVDRPDVDLFMGEMRRSFPALWLEIVVYEARLMRILQVVVQKSRMRWVVCF